MSGDVALPVVTPGAETGADPLAGLDGRAARDLLLTRPESRDALHAWVAAVLGFHVPSRPLVDGHDAPLDYVEHAFFEDRLPRDCLVWAGRGGGKTQLGAVATLLDMIFKPGIQVRILAGSLEQSSRMHRYLARMLEGEHLRHLVDGRITARHIQLANGSRAEVLSQSECAVRGQRVHKLRCDEIELFAREVWNAAQLVTRSGRCGPVHVRAAIEVLGTMHLPFGLMHELVHGTTAAARRIFRWNVLDVLERCPPARPCAGCRIWDDCRGRARHARGFITIDDACQQHARAGLHLWRSEMLCEEPSRADSVYPEFDRAIHVREFTIDLARRLLHPAGDEVRSILRWIGGIDFGFRAPTAMLWACIDDRGIVFVVDELLRQGQTTDAVIASAAAHEAARAMARPEWLGADPAGLQCNDQTGRSTISLWKAAGWPIRARATTVRDGVAAVRSRLRAAGGAARLFIHPRCAELVRAMVEYHYPPDRPRSLEPVKDGHDHVADALRYLIINLDGAGGLTIRRYA
jgi:CYTH domain-containing protein